MIIAFGLLCLSLAATIWGPYHAVNDYHDIRIYYQRGIWVSTGEQPYLDVFSEYPQIATWLFALPHVFAEYWSGENSKPTAEIAYRFVFSGMMALCLAALVALAAGLRKDRRWLAFLLLLPASLYFTQNRFDVLPAFMVLASLAVLQYGRYQGAFILLGVATGIKWYALVLLPVYAAFLYQTNRRSLYPAAVSYGATIAIIFLPTLFIIGLDGFLVPYNFHLTRTMNSESLLHLMTVTLSRAGFPREMLEPLFLKIFLILQFAVAPLCFFARIDSGEKVLRWSAISVLCFMLFAKFYSPQWILWISPLLILLCRTKMEIAGIIVFDLVTYLYFPLIYYTVDKHPLWFPGIIALKTALIGIWMLYLLRGEKFSIAQISSPLAAGSVVGGKE